MADIEAIECFESDCLWCARVSNFKKNCSACRNSNAISALHEKLEREQNEPKTPCDLCAYNPPSSGDGKPCSMCPAMPVEDTNEDLR